MWTYSPRRIAGWLHFARARQKREAAQFLALSANAARAKPADLKKQIKELQKD